MPPAGDRKEIHADAHYLGERIDTRPLEHGEVLARGPLTLRLDDGFAVVFRYGAVVFFGASESGQRELLDRIQPHVSARFEEPELEGAQVILEADGDERVESGGVVRLHEATPGRLQVVAEVLAKSTVLSHYELRVAQLLDRIEPRIQALRGRTHLRIPDRAVLSDIGDVLLAETRMAGRVEVIDKPEISWEDPQLDRLYMRLADEYELRERDVVLARKLELASRIAGTLLDALRTRRALAVEWYIVILILVEIVIIVYDLWLS